MTWSYLHFRQKTGLQHSEEIGVDPPGDREARWMLD